MVRPPSGAGIMYGKIHIYGGESIEECRKELFKVLRKGYPEEEVSDDLSDWEDDDDDDDVEEIDARKVEDEDLKKDNIKQPWQKIVGERSGSEK